MKQDKYVSQKIEKKLSLADARDKGGYNLSQIESKWSFDKAQDKQNYNHRAIERKWQDYWLENGIFSPDLDLAKKPFYNLMMFPYPSAEGLHVGNMYAFCGSDIYGRFKRMQGNDVFEPIGLDGFGIHSENFAIKVGRHPKDQAKISQKNFYRQLRAIGNAYDWDRTLETYDPDYYKWTQWIFIKLFNAGLAYRQKAAVNFCPQDKTVLADEQVIDGRCERCGSEVEKKGLEQWFFRITKYADRLLTNLGKLDWSEKVKVAQKNWIGKKEGAVIKFKIVHGSGAEILGTAARHPHQRSSLRTNVRIKENMLSDAAGARWGSPTRVTQNFTATPDDLYIEVFTTRPDTLYGATFMVLAPEHKIVSSILKSKVEEIKDYVDKAKRKSEQDRIAEGQEKRGVFSGLYAINPVNGQRIPIWVADYVLAGYGTGAIMAVPAHDQRDFEFARRYNLPIKRVIAANRGLTPKAQSLPIGVEPLKQAYTGDGTIVDSGEWNGWKVPQDLGKVIDWLEKKEVGKREVTYHLRDWLISRQRYWGSPIPMVYCETCAKKGRSWFKNSEYSENSAKIRKSDKSESQKNRSTESSEFSEMRGWFPVPEKDLPVLLPDVKDWRPKGEGKSPLSNISEFVNVNCPNCGGDAKRETDVSDTFLDSAWYFLRYTSVDKKDVAWDDKRVSRWLPVDMYIGGAEHSVLHLLYSRFLTMVFKDLGLVDFEEPFSKFRAHGLLISQGAKMSKSKGNIVNPDHYIAKYGADTLRCYLMFCGRFEVGGDFQDKSIEGVSRFLKRVWRIVLEWSEYSENSENSVNQKIRKLGKLSKSEDQRVRVSDESDNLKHRNTDIPIHRFTEYSEYLIHKTIKKVTEDIEDLSYNTAIAALMEWLNALEKRAVNGKWPMVNGQSVRREEVETFLKLLAPFAPHMTEELYQRFQARGPVSSFPPASAPQPFSSHSSSLRIPRHKKGRVRAVGSPSRTATPRFRSIHLCPWPKFDEKLTLQAKILLVVQVNGKVRDKIETERGISEDNARDLAQKSEKVQKYLNGKKFKVIYVPDKLISFVID